MNKIKISMVKERILPLITQIKHLSQAHPSRPNKPTCYIYTYVKLYHSVCQSLLFYVRLVICIQ